MASGQNKWNVNLKDFFSDKRACLLGWCLPCMIFGQNVQKITEGDVPFWRATGLYILAGGCCGAVGSWVVGPIAYWPTCVPCLASYYRNKLRAKNGLPATKLRDCPLHCLCHPCALCQEYKEIRESESAFVPGPHKPTVDEPPNVVTKKLEEQHMER
eukprot:jgi/Mesen1/9195/ME000591S08505